MAFDFLSVGDATLDVFLKVNEAEVECDLDRENCKICFHYADKLPVQKVTKVPGSGNASNAAVGSSRLGLKTSIYSILGDDEVGKMIDRHWKKEGVDLKHVVFDKGRETNYSTVIDYHGERTILVYHEKRDYKFPVRMAKSAWVYYTSMGKGSEALHEPLIDYIKRTGAKLCLQPGTFQMKLGKEALKPLIEVSEVLAINKDEAERITGDGLRDMKELLSELHHMGAAIVLITDGPNGSYTYDGSRFLKLGIFDAPVVERTGAGDAYTTAFCAALFHGKPIGEAMRWGTSNSASVLGKIGPQEGLMTKGELEKELERFKDQHAEEF